MGCFFGCFRVKDKERPRGNVSATLPPVKSRELLIANNQSGRFHGSSQDIDGSSPFLTALSDCTERKKTENLYRRKNNIKWTAQSISSPEVSAVPVPKDSLYSPSPEFAPPATPPPRRLAKARNLRDEEENKEFNDEVKYLKSCGTLLRTPSEIREASERQRTPCESDRNVNSEWHSWFPHPPVQKIQWDGPHGESPTPPAHLHEELCKIPTPNSILHLPKQQSKRFEDKMHQNEDKRNTKQDSGHFGCREDKAAHVDVTSSSSARSYFGSENEDHLQPISPMSSKLLEPIVHKPSRYSECPTVEEDSDSFSDAASISSRDSATNNEKISFNQFDSEASLEPQTPPLFKSTYSPQSTPLRLTGDMNTPWTGCSKTLENAGVNKNARIRSQYVYPVLNPVENLSQWKELKKGILRDLEPKSNSWSERSAMTENQQVILQTPGSREAATDNAMPKLTCSYPISRDSTSKENFLSEEEVKLMPDGLDVIDETSQKRKHIPTTPDPVSKTPKSMGQFHNIPEKTPPSRELHVDSSLSHWLKTPPIEDSNFGQSKKMPEPHVVNQHVETPNSETKTACILSPSSSSPRVPQMLSSPSSKNIDDKPILGALSVQHLQSTSPVRSPSSKSSGDYDRPIIGMVAAHWNDKQSTSPKWWDGKGIPNSTNKYKEDQKVSWHTTPFEERLERALSSEGGGFQRKTFSGKPINFEECEESDTAAS